MGELIKWEGIKDLTVGERNAIRAFGDAMRAYHETYNAASDALGMEARTKHRDSEQGNFNQSRAGLVKEALEDMERAEKILHDLGIFVETGAAKRQSAQSEDPCSG